MAEIMTPKHPQWEEFLDRLEGPEGCNLKEGDNGIEWTCEHDHALATAILKTMPGVDVAGSIAYFEENGGMCDCEILFNVVE